MSTNATVSPDVPARRRLRRPEIGRWTKGFRAFYATLLVGTVVVSLLPTVLFQPHSRVFLLKLAAAALLASLPGLLYLEFIRFKGQTLYDEFVINLFRLGIDRDRNLPAPLSTSATTAAGRRTTTSCTPRARTTCTARSSRRSTASRR